jgi:hypothetical protein
MKGALLPVEPQRPTPRFKAGLAALVAGGCTALLFREPGYSGPEGASCLVPALLGVIDGIWLAHDRRCVTPRVAEGARPRSPALKVRVLVALFLGAALVSVLEDGIAHAVYPDVPFWVRVALIVFLITLGVSELGDMVIRTPGSPTHAESRSED